MLKMYVTKFGGLSTEEFVRLTSSKFIQKKDMLFKHNK